MTTPTEFVLWLNGASGVMGPDGPNGEQWARIQEKLGEAIGKITADRLLERADEQIKVDQERLEKDLKMQAMREQAKSQMAATIQQQMDALTMRHLAPQAGLAAPRPGMVTAEPSLLARMRKKIG